MPQDQSGKHQQLAVMRSGLTIVAVFISFLVAAESAPVAECNVPGFIFRPNQLPGLKDPKVPGKIIVNPFQLYTLPYTPDDECCGVNAVIPTPSDNLPSTVAACEADVQCGLFTSDGYIIGMYRAREVFEEKADSEEDVFAWRPMQYCTWACCGTWVADGLIDQLLQPVPDTPGANDVQSIETSKLPKDTEKGFFLYPDLKTTVCVGQPPPRRKRNDEIPPGSPGCPKRCLAVCCKQLDNGIDSMGGYVFSSCSGVVCGILCGYGKAKFAGPNSAQVLFRQYVRQQSRGPVDAATNAGGASNCSRPGSGDLC